jgi:phosphoglycolate phosphatase
MTELRLILFDVDGTLVDSQAHIQAATRAAFEGVGMALPSDETVRRGVGLSVEQAFERLAPHADEPLRADMVARYRAAFFNIASQGTTLSPLFAGVADMIHELRATEGTVLGVATGKSRRGLERTLQENGLDGIFQTLQVADGHPSKPHPSMILTAMAETGMTAAQTVMIGDTSYDMLMARAAGVASVGVTWGYHRVDDLVAAGADVLIDTITDLPRVLGTLRRE